MSYSMEDLIKYRKERAYETLEEARILEQNEHWNSAVNRLYYACYYMILSLFVKNNIHATTHSGLRSQFHKYFIKTGKISEDLGKHFSDLFNKRNEGDYEDFINFQKKDIMPLFSKTENFLTILNTLIDKKS